jgi:hypothetical protein
MTKAILPSVAGRKTTTMGAALLAVLFLLFPLTLIVNHSTTKSEISVSAGVGVGSNNGNSNLTDNLPQKREYQEAGKEKVIVVKKSVFLCCSCRCYLEHSARLILIC